MAAAANQNPPVAGLGDLVVAPLHLYCHQNPAVDLDLPDRVTPDVVRIGGCAVNRVVETLASSVTNDLPGISDTDQDGSAVGVGHGHESLLQRLTARTGFQFEVLMLALNEESQVLQGHLIRKSLHGRSMNRL
ncbi:hypothetical protein LWF15_06265 [Kineosporia rhizophila]|nr:hypothetical protein [Kineosporia rhizophila]MCE0535105.1 hypothetical protein [Kineosporia rhizophila]